MIDMTNATADDREQVLGAEFRQITVLRASFSEPMVTIAILDGNKVALVGDPQQALAVFLGGSTPTPETAQ